MKAAYSITLPPLRSRREDVGVIFLHLLKTALLENKISDNSLLQRLQDPDPKVRPWLAARDVAAVATSPLPANGRSLLDLARKLALTILDGPLANTHAVVVKFLESDVDPAAAEQASGPQGAADTPTPTPVKNSPDQIVAALERAGWNRRKAAKIMGISPDTFYRWLDLDVALRELLDIDPPDLQRQLRDAGGDVDQLANKLRTSSAILRRILARKR